MEFKEIEYLITLADEGNISRAAEKLYMAQSSLTHFIQEMERSLGIQIFNRSPRGIQLTESGKILVEHMRNMKQEYELAKRRISDLEELRNGHVNFGIGTFRGTYILSEVLKKFTKLYPGISVEIVELSSWKLEEELLAGRVDLALVALPLKHSKNIYWEHLMNDEICLIASYSNPIMKKVSFSENMEKPYISIDALNGETMILGEKNTILGQAARNLIQNHQLEINPYPTTLSPFLAASVVQSGIGITLSYYSWSKFHGQVCSITFKPNPLYVELALAWSPRIGRTKLTRAFADVFHDCFDQEE